MHVETSRSHRVLRDGTERIYERHLLRRSFRDGGKVRKETLANLSRLPPEAITAIRAVLAGKTLIDAVVETRPFQPDPGGKFSFDPFSDPGQML